jgi:hypothetical protein
MRQQQTPACLCYSLTQLSSLTASLPTDGDGASVAKSRRKLAAVVCKRLHDLLACLKVLVGTVIAMPVVIDQQVSPAFKLGCASRHALGCK